MGGSWLSGWKPLNTVFASADRSALTYRRRQRDHTESHSILNPPHRRWQTRLPALAKTVRHSRPPFSPPVWPLRPGAGFPLRWCGVWRTGCAFSTSTSGRTRRSVSAPPPGLPHRHLTLQIRSIGTFALRRFSQPLCTVDLRLYTRQLFCLWRTCLGRLLDCLACATANAPELAWGGQSRAVMDSLPYPLRESVAGAINAGLFSKVDACRRVRRNLLRQCGKLFEAAGSRGRSSAMFWRLYELPRFLWGFGEECPRADSFVYCKLSVLLLYYATAAAATLRLLLNWQNCSHMDCQQLHNHIYENFKWEHVHVEDEYKPNKSETDNQSQSLCWSKKGLCVWQYQKGWCSCLSLSVADSPLFTDSRHRQSEGYLG